MRTTLNIGDELLAQAGEYTGETEKRALVRMGARGARRAGSRARRSPPSVTPCPPWRCCHGGARKTGANDPRGYVALGAALAAWLPDFAATLGQRLISIHPVVVGELATGNLSKRQQTLADLRRLPRATLEPPTQ
ncbi:MAG TPA: type II toxin-antitoxin system VapB family antitoxin [Chthoniobacterales bacterium]